MIYVLKKEKKKDKTLSFLLVWKEFFSLIPDGCNFTLFVHLIRCSGNRAKLGHYENSFVRLKKFLIKTHGG